MKTAICVSNLIGNKFALLGTKKTLVLCYFLLDKINQLQNDTSIGGRVIGIDNNILWLELSSVSGICGNCLAYYPEANSTLFKGWLNFSGVDAYPIKPKTLKNNNDVNAYELCMEYYEDGWLYKGRNLKLRRELLIYCIIQLEWALSHTQEKFNPFECIDKKHWTHTPKQLQTKVKHWEKKYS